MRQHDRDEREFQAAIHGRTLEGSPGSTQPGRVGGALRSFHEQMKARWRGR